MDYHGYDDIVRAVEGDGDFPSAPPAPPGEPSHTPAPPSRAEPSDKTIAECALLDESDTSNGVRLMSYFPDQLLVMKVSSVAGGDKLIWSGTHWDIDEGEAGAALIAQKVGDYIQKEAAYLVATEDETRAMAAVTEAVLDELDALKAISAKERTSEQRRRLREVDAIAKAGHSAAAAVRRRQERRQNFGVQSKDQGRIEKMLENVSPRLRKNIEELNASALSVATRTHTLVFHQEIDPECPDPKATRYKSWIEARKGHRQEDYITALVPVNYDKKAKAPLFEAWIEQMMPDAETRRTLQQFCGCSILGIPLQFFMFHYGEGANGKSVFLEMLVRLLGKSFAVGLPTESIIGSGERAGGGASPDLIRLFGKRMVRVLELPEGKPLQSELIKKLTGGEEIPVRTLYKGYIDFMPRAKPHMSGNGLPKILDTSNGIWRRMLFVKWPIMIAEEDRRDPEVMVREFLSEAPGVFNWLCEGARDFLSGGQIYIAPKVRADVQAYRKEMDIVLQFVEDCVEKAEGETVQARDMYLAFKDWCIVNSKNVVFETRFGRDMKRHCQKDDKSRVRKYLDVKLRDDRPRPTESELRANKAAEINSDVVP
ncbi:MULTISPECIES: phage/plasmid primase, P4 family [unclassified Bradyrhizobium]|uniref:DNA primase family protein n=1 Tax=unclassified Bradyrhizobium TaxID=2631580 RepID=UPI0028EE45A1|nr:MULTISPECIES: phage/plasmid primase, P4 family [unclassified Bradyrhizobium]